MNQTFAYSVPGRRPTLSRARPVHSYYLSRDPRHAILGAARGLVGFLRFAATFAVLAILAIVLRAVMSRHAHRRRLASIRRFIGRSLTIAASVRVVRRGRRADGVPMVVCNHVSWLDSFVLMGEFGSRFVADAVWGATPVLRTALSAVGVLFIDRRSLRDAGRLSRAVGRQLRDGERLLVFPEADTSRGAAVLPFRPALLQAAAAGGLPVGWAAVRYATPEGWPPASVVVAWADWTPLALHMYRAFHPPRLVAEIVYGSRPVVDADRKRLAFGLHAEVSAAFRPMPQPAPDALAAITRPKRARG